MSPPVSDGLLRLVPLDRFAPTPEKAPCCNCHGPHLFATSDLTVIKNGEVVKQLTNTSSGFVTVIP
jgi:hypothetical protein